MLMSSNPSSDEVIMATDAVSTNFSPSLSICRIFACAFEPGNVQNLYAELSDSAMAMEFHCSHDPLTGTWRREAILDLIFKETDRVQRQQTPVSILLLDVDGFTF